MLIINKNSRRFTKSFRECPEFVITNVYNNNENLTDIAESILKNR